MIAIWITLFVVTIISVVSEIYSERGIYLVNNDAQIEKSRPNRVLFLVIILVLILVSGLRSSIGDTGYYMYSYKFTTIDLSKIFTYRDWGYYFFQFALRKISTHPQFILVVTSSITLTLMLKTLYKYTRPLSLGIFLFISSGIYVATMNGLRQYMVAAIIFAATGLIIQKKKWKYFILVLLLSTIHNSILIMIPVYFIVRQKAWSKKLIILIIVSFIIFIRFDNMFGIFSNLLRSTQYVNYLDTFGEANIGANIIRVFVAAIPVILAYVFKDILSEKLEHYNIYVNFSILNFIVILFASYNWIFARLGMYFELYNLILLPAIIKYCFRNKSKALIGYIVIACYAIYLYFDMQPYIYASYFLNINRDLIGPLTKSFY